MSGEFEVDEIYFGAKRVCKKHGHEASKKTSMFLLRVIHPFLC